MSGTHKSIVKENMLLSEPDPIEVGSPLWYEWLSTARKFSFKSQLGSFVAQHEMRRNKAYWYAYRRQGGKLYKSYLGKTEELTLERLQQVGLSIAGHSLIQERIEEPIPNDRTMVEHRGETSPLPMTKIHVPVLPRQLVSRPRLNQKINTPLTLIFAPSGFGKSTLLNDWKQSCGYPVAWLTLDEHDNHPMRFWYSVVIAFQLIHPDFGKGLLPYLDSGTHIPTNEAALRLTNDIINFQTMFPRIGLVLDDFHKVNHAEIYDSIQVWLEHIPSNMQLIISGHTRPPLSLGHLRARGMLTELETNDLRFTVSEGVNYLRQYPQEPPLAYDDLEKLVKHAEGWAVGLTLTALALGKQEDRRRFIDTFSGAHIYLREYFMETVLKRTSPEVQSFLLKTAILKQLTGSLCDAVTGQTDGQEMLARLWQENLFIVRLEEPGWYRYHDLFAEMLYSQLQSHFPEEVHSLHQRAAQWYREQYTPADAIHHLLSIESWDEAATLMEEMSLRELEQSGEDSRLLRWLQELPESVVQKHKDLLFVFLRLANIALPRKKIEKFVAQIEASISSKPEGLRTQDEREVLTEIQAIRHTWAQGDIFTPPSRLGKEYDARWDVIDQLQLLRQVYEPEHTSLENQITELYHAAQVHNNLFVILMSGGILVRRAIVAGQLRRSERVARQLLEQVIARRGTLPGPASITLDALSQVHLERHELELAEKYLNQAMEVDPNPTSSNMLVQSAILRAKLQVARGQLDEAHATIQTIHSLHLLRPSGLWSDQDLITYEAYICIRIGDIKSAERLMSGSVNSHEHPLSRFVQAVISLKKKEFENAEKMLLDLIENFPNGIIFEPLMEVRVLLAVTLFEQNKVNQALQVMTEAIRIATPERFLRPFVENGISLVPLLMLALEMHNLSDDAKVFTREILQRVGAGQQDLQISRTQLETLSTSASISPREQEIIHLLSAGYSNREIATKLSISESTVKTHLGHIYHKLNVNKRVHAISRAKELKLAR